MCEELEDELERGAGNKDRDGLCDARARGKAGEEKRVGDKGVWDGDCVSVAREEEHGGCVCGEPWHMGERAACESDETSTASCETYVPEGLCDGLEVDEDAYRVLEYVSLDWPSQTVEASGDAVLVATNAAGGGGAVVRLGFGATDGYARMERMSVERVDVATDYNRLRAGACVVCVSDVSVDVLGGALEVRTRIGGAFAHGLAVGGERAYCGGRSGALVTVDLVCGRTSERQVHGGAVESVDVHGELVFTASCDGAVCVTDMRARECVQRRELGCEANAVGFNGDGRIVCGGESGSLWVVDMRAPECAEEIAWHRSPVSAVRWRDADVFVSCSDEQAVLWDVSFVDEWEYHRYLSFVHQGQRYYKEAAFGADGAVFTTSYDGVCVFVPVE